MAYAYTIDSQRTRRAGGQTFHIVEITETGVTAATDEYTITGLPFVGTVVEKDVVLTAGDGTATTVDPELGETTTGTEIWVNGAAAASVHDDGSDPFTTVTDGTIYGRSGANGNTGTTGSIATRLTILEGRIS